MKGVCNSGVNFRVNVFPSFKMLLRAWVKDPPPLGQKGRVRRFLTFPIGFVTNKFFSR